MNVVQWVWVQELPEHIILMTLDPYILVNQNEVQSLRFGSMPLLCRLINRALIPIAGRG